MTIVKVYTWAPMKETTLTEALKEMLNQAMERPRVCR